MPAVYPNTIAGVMSPANYNPPTTTPQLKAIPNTNYG